LQWEAYPIVFNGPDIEVLDIFKEKKKIDE